MIDTVEKQVKGSSLSFDLMEAVEVDVRSHPFSHELAAVLSAFDCVLDGSLGLYVTNGLSGGRALYDLLGETGFRTAGELRVHLGDKEFHRRLLDPQMSQAEDLAQSLRLRHPEELVVVPAHFHFEEWGAQDYRTLWGTIIRTRIKALYFGDDWEFSDRCAMEFKVAWEMGLPTFDSEGQSISLPDGRFRIQTAILSLEGEGFETTALAASLQNLGRQNRVAPPDL